MASRKCKKCKHFIFSRTIGSPDVSVWHCRHGFDSHDEDCQDMAEYSLKCQREYYRRHPEDLQFKLKF